MDQLLRRTLLLCITIQLSMDGKWDWKSQEGEVIGQPCWNSWQASSGSSGCVHNWQAGAGKKLAAAVRCRRCLWNVADDPPTGRHVTRGKSDGGEVKVSVES